MCPGLTWSGASAAVAKAAGVEQLGSVQSVWTFYEKEGLVVFQIFEVESVGRKTHERRSRGQLFRRREALIPGGASRACSCQTWSMGARWPGHLGFASAPTEWRLPSRIREVQGEAGHPAEQMPPQSHCALRGCPGTWKTGSRCGLHSLGL